MGRSPPNSDPNAFTKDFSAASSLPPALTVKIGTVRTSDQVPDSLFPNNLVLFRPYFTLPLLRVIIYIWSRALMCHALQYQEEINNIPSVNPEGEVVHGLTQLCSYVKLLQNLTGVHTGTPSRLLTASMNKHSYWEITQGSFSSTYTHTHTHTHPHTHTVKYTNSTARFWG